MIYAKKITKDAGELIIKGNTEDVITEYKSITDYLLHNCFEEFMAAMDKWNEEVKGLND